MRAEPRNNIVRVNENGGVDLSFDPGSGTNGAVRAITPLGSGEILLGGAFTSYDGTSLNGLVCVESDGSIGSNAPQPNIADVRSITTDEAGRYLVTGGFSNFGGTSVKNIGRLNSDLSLDPGFNGNNGPDGPVNGVALMPEGKLLIVGDFSNCGGNERGGVVLLHENGVIDPGFDPQGGANGPVRHAVRKAGGKVVLVGDFTTFAGVSCAGTVRLNEDGTIDLGLADSTLQIESVRQGH